MGFLSDFPKTPTDISQYQIEKFVIFIEKYLKELDVEQDNTQPRCITLIARSPAAPAARALVAMTDELGQRRVAVSALFVDLGAPHFTDFTGTLSRLHAGSALVNHLRLVINPRLLEAHEQLVLGSSLCWTGDVLRRSDHHRNALDLFEDQSPEAVRLAMAAFAALWEASKPVSGRVVVRLEADSPKAMGYALAAAQAPDGQRRPRVIAPAGPTLH